MNRIADTENGKVRGLPGADPRITVFKGIPFAAPPTGENRWRAPQPCRDWEGVREAYEFAPISIQDTPGLGSDIYCREWHVDPEIPMDEDCLYLNVWTGAGNPKEKLPVLVWFFGGGFQWGYPAEMEFDGERLARRGIIVVSVNYRLGALGFMAHPELTAEQPAAPTNFGCLDQQAGLKWVIRNIAAFGGDPGRITLAGQSAGGASVLAQMNCPENEGLFQRAIVLSGMIRSPYEEDKFITPGSLEAAEQKGVDFLEVLGVDSIAQARELDALYIRDKYAEYASSHPRMSISIDGHFCPGEPMKRYMRGEHIDVPVMAGNTEDEFPNLICAASRQEYQDKVREIFGEKAERFLAFPEAGISGRDPLGGQEAAGAGEYAAVSGIECTVKSAFIQDERNGFGGRNYYYRFAPQIPGWDHPGTFHSVDLWFFFETLAKCWRPFTGKHYDLARQMCNYWANFVKTGDPNGQDADGSQMPRWEPYTAEYPCEMVFTTQGPLPGREKDSPFLRFLMEALTERLLGK